MSGVFCFGSLFWESSFLIIHIRKDTHELRAARNDKLRRGSVKMK